MIDLPHDRLMALFEISHRINRISDLQTLLNEILHSAISNIGAERGLIILTDEERESFHTVASQSLEDEDITFSKSIVQATLESGQTSLSQDIKSDVRFKDTDSVQELHILSFICVPLIIPETNRPLGTLYVDQRAGVKAFTQEDVAFLEAFANLAAIAIKNTSTMERIMNENIRLYREVEKKYEFPGVIGQSELMQKVFREAKQIMDDDCTVLLTGESGSGKEVIAKAIHYNGNRKAKPFLAINCGALPETLLEAELFGSVRGAFTGALDKQGLFQAAHGGTLFLDEIHHTSEVMQIKLLRVLQDKEIRRVGGTKSTKVDVRLICATNEDLQKAVQDKRFRQDFYYRMNVVTINIPPLRERHEDIPLLAQYFLEKYANEKKKSIRGFDRKALGALVKYDWSENNVRELENEIEHAVIFAKDSETIKLNDLSDKLKSSAPYTREAADLLTDEEGQPLTYDKFEKKYIQSVLSRVNGNKAKAAKIMGIPRSTLRGKLRKFGLGQ
ncbi:MAG: sigma 54-interacting transcriptional regulator [candidate division WOR-3 bacterium]|nr:MAG: sigma 54-interacting transcriptional regulator [candidate division WOR-3 bacterium]